MVENLVSTFFISSKTFVTRVYVSWYSLLGKVLIEQRNLSVNRKSVKVNNAGYVVTDQQPVSMMGLCMDIACMATMDAVLSIQA